MARISPAENDMAIAVLGDKYAEAEHERAQLRNQMHRTAGDERAAVGRGRDRTYQWQLSYDEVTQRLAEMAAGEDRQDYYTRMRPSDAIARDLELCGTMGNLAAQIRALEENWIKANWTRWYPCQNSDGHVHASERGCKTVRWDTNMGWFPELSGKTVAEAIAEFGPRLCSVCFPDAPAEHCRSLSDITRADREAAKAAREEAKYAKRLRREEQFRDHRNDWVETVARCKDILRAEVEYRDYFGRGEHSWHAASVVAAVTAAATLLAREAAHPGTGATQAEIETIIERAVKKNRKEGARI